jgi:predicted nucleotide-binding protein (sugar kinase/HSP70/actin superfamily)
MKLTFPHMGNTYITLKALLDTLNVNYYIPPIGSRESLELGIANSPEFMCLPFKKVLGDLIQGLNHGADTILFGNSCGQCRLSHYGDLLQNVLHDMGYKFNYINLNFRDLTYSEILNKLGPFLPSSINRAHIFSAVTNAVKTIFEVDGLYSKACNVRCRESHKGDTDIAIRLFEQKAKISKGFPQIHQIIRETKDSLAHIRTNDALNPVKIGIIGEIFISSDPFTNLQIEKKLGNMGALALNTMSTSEWIRKHFINALLPIKPRDKAVQAAQNYMHTDYIGGHGIYTIGNAELMCRNGIDGIIQIYPFTCMPEITAKSVLNEVQLQNNVPIMTLILDEMTAETGYITRLEAFVDMLKMKKDRLASL